MIDLLRILAEAQRSAPAARPPSPFDFLRLQAMVYEESRRIHDLLFDRLIAPAVAPEGADAPADDAIASVLRRAQLLLLKHPIAAQAAFAALIAEGRRFAATPEGAEWEAALAGSDLVKRGRRVWDAVGMSTFEDDPATIVPSAYLEALFRAIRSADLDELLGRLQGAPKGGEHASPR